MGCFELFKAERLNVDIDNPEKDIESFLQSYRNILMDINNIRKIIFCDGTSIKRSRTDLCKILDPSFNTTCAQPSGKATTSTDGECEDQGSHSSNSKFTCLRRSSSL
jgi:hypothetical protein